MKRLLLVSLLTLASCGAPRMTAVPPVVVPPVVVPTPPVVPPPVVVPPVTVPTPPVEPPAPQPPTTPPAPPVIPPVVNPLKDFEKLGDVPNLCEILVRPDEKIENRYWLYTKDCRGYVLVKWFANLTDERSTSYIGLVGYETEAYIDTGTHSNNAFFYLQGADPNELDLHYAFDVGRTYYPLYKVKLTKKDY